MTSYEIETKALSSFSREATLLKNASIKSDQNLTVTAQTRWSVNAIRANIWDTVTRGKVIIQLWDSLDNIWLQVERANLAVQNARLNLATTEANLNKTIQDTQLWLQQAEQSLQTTQTVTQQQIRQALQNLNDAQLSSEASTAALEIQKLETEITLQLRNLVTNFNTQQQWFLTILGDTLYESDLLLWVTEQYRLSNEDIEEFLWAKDVVLKNRLENQLLALYRFQKEYIASIVAETENISSLQDKITLTLSWYDAIISFLLEVEQLLKQSITAVTFPQSQIDGLIAKISWLRSRARWEKNAFVAYTQQVDGSLTTWQDGLLLIEQQLTLARKRFERQTENAQIAYDTTLANAEDQLARNQINVQSAQNSLKQALDNRGNQVDILQNAIRDAQKNLNDAQRRVWQLTITSPISGIIDDILVDVWQDVWGWTPVFSIVANDEKQAEIFISETERNLIKVWSKAIIVHGDKTYTWRVSAVATVANAALQYKVTIESKSLSPLSVWSVVNVVIPFTINKRVVPLKYITLTQENTWYLYLWRDNEIVREFVSVGKTRWNSIEILDPLPLSTRVIVTSLENYNELVDLLVVDGEEFDFRPVPTTWDVFSGSSIVDNEEINIEWSVDSSAVSTEQEENKEESEMIKDNEDNSDKSNSDKSNSEVSEEDWEKKKTDSVAVSWSVASWSQSDEENLAEVLWLLWIDPDEVEE